MNTSPHTHMPDLTQRPTCYWEDIDPLALVLQNVKGTNRRKIIKRFWAAGSMEALHHELLEEEVAPDVLEILQAVHPTFMGGEYLPDYLPSEVEIARIELESTLADVTSIRAWGVPGDNRIHYRVVDEYDTTFEIEPTVSDEPLTLGELIQLIDTVNDGDGGGLALTYNNHCLTRWSDLETLRHFTNISSSFYPGLEPFYKMVHEDWFHGLAARCLKNPSAPPPSPILQAGQFYVPPSRLDPDARHPKRTVFKRHDKVVCVNDEFERSVFGIPEKEFDAPHGVPIKGQVYTVRSVANGQLGTQGLFLVGLQTSIDGREVGFNSTRFRKVHG